MQELRLHIVSFTIPYPADYGGVMDVYHKIRLLQREGVKIILHAFRYDREPAPHLASLCEEVHYYRRANGWRMNIGAAPYIMKSRDSEELLTRLNMDDYPILYEGLHTCYRLGDPVLAGRNKIVRAHNIEHDYYSQLSKASTSPGERIYLRTEALRLKRAEKILSHAQKTAAISLTDQIYFERKYGNAFWLPPFHSSDRLSGEAGRGHYLLFHGNLSVAENEKAALHLIRNVFRYIDYPTIIAGKNPGNKILDAAGAFQHIQVEANPVGSRMEQLIANAHISVLFSSQPTGMKLKLLESLFRGRLVVTNPLITAGSGLEALCFHAGNDREMVDLIKDLIAMEYTEEMKTSRANGLSDYDNEKNAHLLIKEIWGR